jgi:hypothetical protein
MSKSDQACRRRPFFFRIPDELRERLTAEAEEAERSLAAEMVFRLRKSLERRSDKAAGRTTPIQK